MPAGFCYVRSPGYVINLIDTEMDKNSGSAIVGAIAIIIVVLPIILMGRVRRKKEKRFLSLIAENAKENNCKLDMHEIVGDLAIGVDKTRGWLFFYSESGDGKEEYSIDLSGIKICTVLKTCRSYSDKGKSQNVIEKLGLNLIPVAGESPSFCLEFYNMDSNGQLSGELQSVGKWAETINGCLSGSRR